MSTSVKLLIVLATASSLSLSRANADTDIVNNLAASASDVSGLKNQASTSYAQGFVSPISGALASLTLDLGLQQSNSGPGPDLTSGETLSLYLYTASSNGTPITEVAPLVTGITESEIAAGTSLGFQSNNDSFIYQVSLTSSLLNNPALSANTDYAIVFTPSSGVQDIGWAEENGGDPTPLGELNKLQPPGGYGRLELDVAPVPEPSSWMLGLGACALFVGLRRRRAPLPLRQRPRHPEPSAALAWREVEGSVPPIPESNELN